MTEFLLTELLLEETVCFWVADCRGNVNIWLTTLSRRLQYHTQQ